MNLLLAWLVILLSSTLTAHAQKPTSFQFGQITTWNEIMADSNDQGQPLQWIDVNTSDSTWEVKGEELICYGNPIGVARSSKQYENFLLHVEWKHTEPGGNSGIFVWSNAIPGEENRLPDGVEVQMLELELGESQSARREEASGSLCARRTFRSGRSRNPTG